MFGVHKSAKGRSVQPSPVHCHAGCLMCGASNATPQPSSSSRRGGSRCHRPPLGDRRRRPLPLFSGLPTHSILALLPRQHLQKEEQHRASHVTIDYRPSLPPLSSTAAAAAAPSSTQLPAWAGLSRYIISISIAKPRLFSRKAPGRRASTSIRRGRGTNESISHAEQLNDSSKVGHQVTTAQVLLHTHIPTIIQPILHPRFPGPPSLLFCGQDWNRSRTLLPPSSPSRPTAHACTPGHSRTTTPAPPSTQTLDDAPVPSDSHVDPLIIPSR